MRASLSAARAAAARGVHLLYPERCVQCGRFGQLLCEACAARMVPTTAGPRCPHCCAPWDGGGNCPRCLHWDALDRGLAAFDHEGPARRVVHALKYESIEAAASLMAGHIAPLRDRLPFDIAFAVPLHRSRQRRRGFNQSQLILEATGWPQAEGRLRRIRKTSPQVGQRLGERRRNVAGAFAHEGPRLEALTVAVLDDVITTGATVNECARVLRDHGARSVVALAFSRAPYPAAAAETLLVGD